MSGTILQAIVETKRDEIAAARRAESIEALRARCAAAPPPRDIYSAVTSGPTIRLIAEIKKASPSAGVLRDDFRPTDLARVYESAGASALSVLTDRTYFQGSLADLAAVRAACALPVLRKDFTIDAYQVYEARAAGADAILLIAEILTVVQIDEFGALAASLGMASLIESHTAAQAAAVLPLISPARRAVLGVNNRDLHAQRTDVGIAQRIAATLPPGTPIVAESGLKSREDVQAMAAAGACAVLIGETFLRAPDPAAKARELMGW